MTPAMETSAAITWYTMGQILPPQASSMLGPDFGKRAVEHTLEQMPGVQLIPTTYEAADTYLKEELKKPKGGRNLLREMCMIVPLNLPQGRNLYYKSDATKSLIQMVQGAIMLMPTIDIPPHAFGTQRGYIDHENLVWDPQTREPQRGVILLAYFTQTRPAHSDDLDKTAGENAVRLDFSPYE